MSDVAEKRVYGDAAGDQTAFVAGAPGVVAVRVSAGHVGRFGLVDDRAARDAAAAPPAAGWPPVAVAGADDVRVGDADGLAPTGFGPAVAVGFDGDALVAAGPDGRVARADAPDAPATDAPNAATDDGTGDGSGRVPVEWTDLGTAGQVRAVDGPLVAGAGGVFRVVGDELTPGGLADVRDVAAAGPFAATGDGLYRLGNGWQDVLDGAFRFVASEAGGRGRTHAGPGSGEDGTGLWARGAGGEWAAVDLPASVADETVVGAGYGAVTYAVTDEGTLLAGGGGTGDGEAESALSSTDWRAHPLGVRDVAALAVAGGDVQS